MTLEIKTRVKTLLLRCVIVLGSFAVYAALSLLFHDVGIEILYLVLIPVALSGALMGVLGGLVGAAFGYLLSEILYRTAFPVFEDYTIALWILDFTVTLSIGALTGYLSRIIGRQKYLIAQLKTTAHNKEILIKATEDAKLKSKELSEIISICSYCKKIHDAENEWQEVEVYFRNRANIKFSHSICPTCIQIHHHEYFSHEKPTCPLFQTCSFFGKREVSATDLHLKDLYCYMSYQKCAIFNRMESNRQVPDNLLPNGQVISYHEPC